jgi:hypothetical protein
MTAGVRLPYCPLQVSIVSGHRGRAIAQAVSRRLSTAVARARARVRSCGICGGQSDAGAGFLRVLRFPLPPRIPPIAPQSPSTIWGWYSRPNSGRSTKWTQSHPTRKKKLSSGEAHKSNTSRPNVSSTAPLATVGLARGGELRDKGTARGPRSGPL